jgi:hypothetical protein
MVAVPPLRHAARVVALAALVGAMIMALSPAGWAVGPPEDRGPAANASSTAHERSAGEHKDARPTDAQERRRAEPSSAAGNARAARSESTSTSQARNRPATAGAGQSAERKAAAQQKRVDAQQKAQEPPKAKAESSAQRPAERSSTAKAAEKDSRDREHRGNSGSIKVNPVGYQDGTQPPRNHPHVGCVFDVNFYGFYGSVEDVTFAVQPPSGHGITLEVEPTSTTSYDDTPPGGNTLVMTQRYDLTDALAGADVEEHHTQGYHVKVTSVGDREGSGNRKHKVFWVSCGEEAAAATGGVASDVDADAGMATTQEPVETDVLDTTAEAGEVGTTADAGEVGTTADAGVLDTTADAGVLDTTADAGEAQVLDIEATERTVADIVAQVDADAAAGTGAELGGGVLASAGAAAAGVLARTGLGLVGMLLVAALLLTAGLVAVRRGRAGARV